MNEKQCSVSLYADGAFSEKIENIENIKYSIYYDIIAPYCLTSITILR